MNPLKEKFARGLRDMIGAPAIGVILHAKLAVGPQYQPVKRVLAAQLGALGVENISLVKIDRALARGALDLKRAGAMLPLDGLQKVDHRDVGQIALKRVRLPAAQARLGALLEQELHPTRHFLDIDGLGQVLVGAHFQAAHLLGKRALFGQEYEGNGAPFGVISQALAEGKTVLRRGARELRITHNHVGLTRLNSAARLADGLGDNDSISSFLEADFEYFLTLGVGIDDQNSFVRHAIPREHLRRFLLRGYAALLCRCDADNAT